MCKELVSIPWTSKPWVLSECHCLMPDYFVSNILSVCNLAVAWFEHNYSIPSLRKNSGWRAVYRALLIFPACFGSLGAILAILLLHVAFHGGAWQDFKGRKHLVLASLARNACNGDFKENEVYKRSVQTSHAHTHTHTSLCRYSWAIPFLFMWTFKQLSTWHYGAIRFPRSKGTTGMTQVHNSGRHFVPYIQRITTTILVTPSNDNLGVKTLGVE